MILTLEDCTVARAVFVWAARRRHPTGEGIPFSWRMHNHYMRNVIRYERWLVSCYGKHAFLSYRIAEQAASRPRDGWVCVVYRCRFCRAFHIGHSEPRARRARGQLMDRKMERAHAP